MPLSPEDWRRRYLQQAGWTADLRRFLFERIGLRAGQSVLDVGCGAGALLPEIDAYTHNHAFGLDISAAALRLAAQDTPQARLVNGDAHTLPFAAGCFDVVLCHFVLLWLADPAAALAEMRRVARPGGYVVALAEPDYGGRIDYPPELEILGRWQTQALHHQGADPLIGRRLAELFTARGLKAVNSGVLGGLWPAASASAEDWALEWQVLQADLKTIPAATPQALAQLERQALAARKRGAQITYVPTFYAWGKR